MSALDETRSVPGEIEKIVTRNGSSGIGSEICSSWVLINSLFFFLNYFDIVTPFHISIKKEINC